MLIRRAYGVWNAKHPDKFRHLWIRIDGRKQNFQTSGSVLLINGAHDLSVLLAVLSSSEDEGQGNHFAPVVGQSNRPAVGQSHRKVRRGTRSIRGRERERNRTQQDQVSARHIFILPARCHDHKYDPLTQADYYRFRAIFEPHQVRYDRVPGELDTEKNGLARVYDDDLAAETFLLIAGDIQNPDKERKLTPAAPAVFDDVLAPRTLNLNREAAPSVAADPLRRRG